MITVASHTKKDNPPGLPSSPSSPPTAPGGPYVLTGNGAGHQTALSLDRYIRVRARHAQTYRPQLWLGVSNRGPVTANGFYQMIVRRGR